MKHSRLDAVSVVLYTHASFPCLRHASENGLEIHGPDWF